MDEMYKKLSKLQKMYGEIFFVSISILLIAAIISSKMELEYEYKRENEIRFHEDSFDHLLPYVFGFFIWGVYSIVWYLRICFQNVDAPENESKSYKNIVNFGCLPTLLLVFIVIVLLNVFIFKG